MKPIKKSDWPEYSKEEQEILYRMTHRVMRRKYFEKMKSTVYSKHDFIEKRDRTYRAPYEIWRDYCDNHWWRLMACRDSVLALAFWQSASPGAVERQKGLQWYEAKLVPLEIYQKFLNQSTNISVTRTQLNKLHSKARGEASVKQRRKPWNPFKEDDSSL